MHYTLSKGGFVRKGIVRWGWLAGIILVLAGCASKHEPEPIVDNTPSPSFAPPAPKSVLLEASRTKVGSGQFTAEIALTNETSTAMVVHPKDITCQRGETKGKAASVFHRTNRNIDLFPNRMVRFQLVCKTGKAKGNLLVTVPRAYPRAGRGKKEPVQIAAEWSYWAEEDGGNRNVSSNSE